MNVTVCDVGPRDGLQNYRDVLSPSTRAELCDRLSDTGLPRIEFGSFVSPTKVPQMAGAEEVFDGLHRRDGVIYAALALNLRGVAARGGRRSRRAAHGLPAERHVRAAQPGHDARRGRRGPRRRWSRAPARRRLRTSVTLAAAFGCPFEGPVDPGSRQRARRADGGSGRGRDHARRLDRRRRARPGPAPGPAMLAQAGRPAGGPASAQHPEQRLRQRARGPRARGHDPRRVDRRSRRLPVRARPPATSRPRTSCTCSTERASTPASTSTP